MFLNDWIFAEMCTYYWRHHTSSSARSGFIKKCSLICIEKFYLFLNLLMYIINTKSYGFLVHIWNKFKLVEFQNAQITCTRLNTRAISNALKSHLYQETIILRERNSALMCVGCSWRLRLFLIISPSRAQSYQTIEFDVRADGTVPFRHLNSIV